jgi:general secretion pathway protein A
VYREYYGLKEKPFSLTPDPQFLYLSEGHRTAIESLLYGIRQKEGFMVLTGDIGLGKTTLCRALLSKLDHRVKTAVIFNSFLTEGKLLEAILRDFGLPSKRRTKHERIDALNQFLLDLLSHDEEAVLMIDEAQNLSIPVLEQIRMLSNLETEKEKLLQIVLLGQLELDQKLQSPEMKQLNQRIALRCRLLPLNRQETEDYIYQRLTAAGAQGHLSFSKSALNEIHRFTGGVPRLINLCCERTLLSGYVASSFHFDRKMVIKAKASLLAEEAGKPSSLIGLWRRHKALFASLLLAFLMAVVLIFTNQGAIPFFEAAGGALHEKIHELYSQISGPHPALSNAPPNMEHPGNSPEVEKPKVPGEIPEVKNE